MSPENPKIEYWQMALEQQIEYDISGFEEMAREIYQAEAAKFFLDQLKKNSAALTENHRQRLLATCEEGMKSNPKNSKEWLLFRRFKEEDIPRLFQSP